MSDFRNRGPFDFGVWAQCLIMGPFILIYKAFTEGFVDALYTLIGAVIAFGSWYLLRRKAWHRVWGQQR